MNRPLAVSRQDHIVNALDSTGAVSVSVLAERLGVSRETIRRDLKALADQGRANLVHGGAARGATAEPSLSARHAANAPGKAAIGRKAASFIEDGMAVILDSGSTTFALAHAMTERKDLTVLTNSLPIGLLLCRSSGVKVTMLGGEIDANDEAAFGVDTLSALARFRVDLVFIGVGGISPEGDLTDYSRLAAEQRRMMMEAGRQVYILADHTKFERRTPVKMTPVAHIVGLIVDMAPPKAIEQAVAARHWPIIQALE
jgi:DeoR/GlpR family transcriptional regulator of sugar metabolism